MPAVSGMACFLTGDLRHHVCPLHRSRVTTHRLPPLMSSDTPVPVPASTPAPATATAAVDKNYVSFWFWFFTPLLLGIPCFGPVIAIVLAFVGDNESRKNYFRAMLAWIVIALLFWIVMMVAFGLSVPMIMQALEELRQEMERQQMQR